MSRNADAQPVVRNSCDPNAGACVPPIAFLRLGGSFLGVEGGEVARTTTGFKLLTRNVN